MRLLLLLKRSRSMYILDFISLQRMDCHVPPRFREEEKQWEKLVKISALSERERIIHERHKTANETGREQYEDPETGFSVMTRLAHYRRGYCCGNCCRHCPYGQMNVLPSLRTKKFNSAFYD